MNSKTKPGKRKLYIPNDVPAEQWCDFRIDYEAGMTLHAIAEKYLCDSRTVRNAIIHNKSSNELGRKTTPTILANYESRIRELIAETGTDFTTLYQLSRHITSTLEQEGYHGSERSVRNYLSRHPEIQNSKENSHYDPD